MSAVITNPHETSALLSDNEVVQLREWGTDRIHGFPPQAQRCLIGSDPSCFMCLSDPSVLPSHAQLSRERKHWLIHALGDSPGLLQDGVRCNTFALQPGIEIGVGSTTLIAESRSFIALRDFFSRILGWQRDRMVLVDHALRSIRASLTFRAPLLLCGNFDLPPLAHSLHRRTLGIDRPFVVCDPRRQTEKESVRYSANYQTAAAAVEAAAGGSLCVRGYRLPKDFSLLRTRLLEPGSQIQLILCLHKPQERVFPVTPIRVPSLTDRHDDLPRIVDEYTTDAFTALDVPPRKFTSADRSWILRHATTSLLEIEKTTLRMAALAISPSVPLAAERLGMAPVSLLRWMDRRKILSH